LALAKQTGALRRRGLDQPGVVGSVFLLTLTRCSRSYRSLRSQRIVTQKVVGSCPVSYARFGSEDMDPADRPVFLLFDALVLRITRTEASETKESRGHPGVTNRVIGQTPRVAPPFL
jgi:hypothetical protein